MFSESNYLLRSNSYQEISNLRKEKIGRDVLDVAGEVQPRVNVRYCNSYFTSKLRGVGKIQLNTYAVYWDVAVTTSNWKKGVFGWYKIKADQLINQGYVNIRYKNTPISSWTYLNAGAYNSSYGSKKKDIYLTIKSWYSGPPAVEFLDADVEHKITDHGSLVSCTNMI
ncbi:hypothetical protein [Portibacter lacus]|uniref:Uncharacterized protein n=1 Tax=Portibacter lacus TaxID=1099794 RepID=A0AA37SU80_9BACT|nr:hypothetical protein [Portibacter lacus]GLR19749.1 hypothetical protein GCM10007940_43650 [Portibacter lacus]